MYLSTALTLASLSNLFPSAIAKCSDFTARGANKHDTSFTTSGSTHIVSAVVNCSNPSTFNSEIEGPIGTLQHRCNSTECPLYMPANYQVRLNRTLNVTTSSPDVADDIFALINKLGYFQLADSTNLNQSWVYGVSQVSTCLFQGTEGYWGLTPKLRCVDGTLSGCDANNGDPADGTAVRACGVATLGALSGDVADGTLRIVSTGGLESRPPPANATLTDEEQNEARAVRLSGTVAVVVLAVVGCAVML